MAIRLIDIPADRLGMALKGNASPQPPATLGSPSDRGPKPVPNPKRTSMAIKKKKPDAGYTTTS